MPALQDINPFSYKRLYVDPQIHKYRNYIKVIYSIS